MQITPGNGGATGAGSDVSSVTVSPDTSVSVTFDDVTSGGITTVVQMDSDDASYAVEKGNTLLAAYNISTSAGTSGKITISIKYGEVSGNVKVYHNGVQIPNSDVDVDTDNNIVTFTVDSFSEFIIVDAPLVVTGVETFVLSLLALTFVGLGLWLLRRERRTSINLA